MARPHLILDLSRLLWHAGRFAPTGIDRVELAYAKHLIAVERDRLSFAAWWGRLGLLPPDRALAYVMALDALWSGAGIDRAHRRDVLRIARGLRLGLLLRGSRGLEAHTRSRRHTYILVSHQHLDRPKAFFQLRRRTGTRFICFVHDLIPIEHPEYVPFGHALRHRRRIRSLAHLADGLIVNSIGTGRALLRHWADPMLRQPPILVAPLGIDLPTPSLPAAPTTRRPYFVYVATIEPRKNHRLLFVVWQRLAAEYGERAPRLLLIGRRGFRSSGILAVLSRSKALESLIELQEALPDAPVANFVAGAQALLFPSFAEGFGLPLAEALAIGVPALCSDLPELRETGESVPEYLDPTDVAQWRAAIIDYTKPDSLRRARQINRLKAWRAPRWTEHFAAVGRLLDTDAMP